MPKTKAVIVYSPGHAAVRRVTVPTDDDPDDWDDHRVPDIHCRALLPGEAVLVVDLDDYHAHGPHALLERHLGVPPVPDRCVLVDDSGVVISVHRADPAIDRPAGGRLVPHESAGVGERLPP